MPAQSTTLDSRQSTWNAILAALCAASGFERGVVYDVPREVAPRRRPGSPVFLDGSAEWQRFLAARRACDRGQLTPILCLRTLDRDERLLVTDWGTAYANAFLLIEPRDPRLDLTDEGDLVRRDLLEAAEGRQPAEADASGGASARGGALRETAGELFGVWTCWTWTPLKRRAQAVVLRPASGQTLADALLAELRTRFPQEAFDLTLFDLYRRESELFGGSVTRARMPFRTRLGLPILHDERLADRAMRRLVNEGGVRAYHYSSEEVTRYGPGRPVPETVSDAEFARLRM